MARQTWSTVDEMNWIAIQRFISWGINSILHHSSQISTNFAFILISDGCFHSLFLTDFSEIVSIQFHTAGKFIYIGSVAFAANTAKFLNSWHLLSSIWVHLLCGCLATWWKLNSPTFFQPQPFSCGSNDIALQYIAVQRIYLFQKLGGCAIQWNAANMCVGICI